jgi:hypothetical protein
MPRREWVETIVMIAVLLVWWPSIFAPVFPALSGFAHHPIYRHLLFIGTPIILLIILGLRIARYRQALKEANEIAAQRAQVDNDRRLR